MPFTGNAAGPRDGFEPAFVKTISLDKNALSMYTSPNYFSI
jgi:hypothetical protein